MSATAKAEGAQKDEDSRVNVRRVVRWKQLLEALGGSVEEVVFPWNERSIPGTAFKREWTACCMQERRKELSRGAWRPTYIEGRTVGKHTIPGPAVGSRVTKIECG